MITGYQLRDKFINGRTNIENDILLDDTLTPTEKFIYIVIEMLSYRDGFCSATDIQLEDMTGQTFNSIASGIKKLKQKSFIVVDTKQSRKPYKRRIFTLDRFLKLHWANKLPKDCTIKKPPTPPKNRLNKDELNNNFMKFRKFVRQYLTEQSFKISSEGKLFGKTIKIKQNGYYTNLTDNKDLTREQSTIFEGLLWDKREEILNAFFKDKNLQFNTGEYK